MSILYHQDLRCGPTQTPDAVWSFLISAVALALRQHRLASDQLITDSDEVAVQLTPLVVLGVLNPSGSSWLLFGASGRQRRGRRQLG